MRRTLLTGALLGLVALIAPSAATAGPLVYKSAKRVVAAHSAEGVLAACPFGTQVTGGGGSINVSALTLSSLTEIQPASVGGPGQPPRDGFAAGAYNESEIDQTVRVKAICLRRGQSQLVDVVEQGAIAADQTEGGIDALCGPGLRVVGGGAGMEGPSSGITGLLASGPLADGPPGGWTMSARRPIDGFERTIRAAAACLPAGLRTLRYRKRETAVAAGATASLRVRCRRAFQVSGGGVVGQFQMLASLPYDGRDKGKAPDDGWRVRVRNRTLSPRELEVTAICLK